MKKRMILMVSMIALAIAPLQAQNTVPADQVYQKGDHLFSVGTSVFGNAIQNFNAGFPLPAVVSLEFGIHEFISVGPAVSFRRYSTNIGGLNYGFNDMSIGGRASVHLTSFISEWTSGDFDLNNLDVYVAVVTGVRYSFFSDLNNVPGQPNPNINLSANGYAGFRYYFTPKIGFYAEIGSPSWTGVANGGFTFKL